MATLRSLSPPFTNPARHQFLNTPLPLVLYLASPKAYDFCSWPPPGPRNSSITTYRQTEGRTRHLLWCVTFNYQWVLLFEPRHASDSSSGSDLSCPSCTTACKTSALRRLMLPPPEIPLVLRIAFSGYFPARRHPRTRSGMVLVSPTSSASHSTLRLISPKRPDTRQIRVSFLHLFFFVIRAHLLSGPGPLALPLSTFPAPGGTPRPPLLPVQACVFLLLMRAL